MWASSSRLPLHTTIFITRVRSCLSTHEYTRGLSNALTYANHLAILATIKLTLTLNEKHTLTTMNGAQKHTNVPMTTEIVLAAFRSCETRLNLSSWEILDRLTMSRACFCATQKILLYATTMTINGRRKLAENTNKAYPKNINNNNNNNEIKLVYYNVLS